MNCDRSMVQRSEAQGLGLRVLGARVLGSAPPPAKKTAGQIEKETLKKRISNNECRISKEFILSILIKLTEYHNFSSFSQLNLQPLEVRIKYFTLII